MNSGYISKISYMYTYFLKHFGIVKTIKGIFFYNYRILKRQFLEMNKEQILNINGHKFITIPNDKGISEELLMFKIHEPLSTSLLLKILKKGMTCLDIGSNIGYYTCLESKIVGDEGKVISIEPSPINFQYLKRNVGLQKLKNIEIHNFACGDKDGEIELAISDRSNWSRVVSNDLAYVPEDKILKTIQVPIRKIDSFLEEQPIGKIDFIRMDVEGYELNIMSGMKNTIEKFKPLFHVEVHSFFLGPECTKDFLKLLQNYGYKNLFYVAREMEVPMLGTVKDISSPSIDDLLNKLDENKLPMNFMLFLKPKENKN